MYLSGPTDTCVDEVYDLTLSQVASQYDFEVGHFKLALEEENDGNEERFPTPSTEHEMEKTY